MCGHEHWAYLRDMPQRLLTQLNTRIDVLQVNPPARVGWRRPTFASQRTACGTFEPLSGAISHLLAEEALVSVGKCLHLWTACYDLPTWCC